MISVVQASGQPAPEEIKRPLVLVTNMKYFYGSYLTVLIAVIFRITIGWLYSTTKMLEPFHMLNQEEGVPAKDFFNINYLSANDTFEPFTAMLSGHWQMLAVSLLYATVGFLAPFASEMLHFYRSCEKFENGEIICGAALWINASIARILEGLLICISVLLVVVWGLVRSCASGIYSDPSSIASVCSLLHHPETIVEFQRLDQGASKENIIRNLSGRRFRLDAYQATDGIERYGLISSGNYADDEMDGLYKPIGTVDLHDKPVSKASGTSWRRYSFSWRIVRLAMELLLPITTAGTLILVAYYYKDSSKDGYNRFMNSEGFGPRFLITCVGIIIHTQWTRLERQHSVLEPFRRLHTGHATPESTILISRSLFHVTAFFTSLYRRSYFIALVAFVAVMAEVLIIILPGVPFNSSEIARSFTISSYLSIAILALMLVVLAAIWLRPKGPALPRTPNTLGTLCLYLCDSQMRFELSDMAYMKKGERDYAVRDLEREYVLLSGLGDNGEIRWRVDYDGNDGYGE